MSPERGRSIKTKLFLIIIPKYKLTWNKYIPVAHLPFQL